MDHWLYLLLAVVTHAVVGYALVRVLTPITPLVGILGGVAPDVDLLLGRFLEFPLVHRGLVHTPFFLALLLGGLLLVDSPEWVTLGVGVAFCSHLVLDTFTNAGIMWLYPVSVHHLSYDISLHSFVGDCILCAASLGIVRWGGRNKLQRLAHP